MEEWKEWKERKVDSSCLSFQPSLLSFLAHIKRRFMLKESVKRESTLFISPWVHE